MAVGNRHLSITQSDIAKVLSWPQTCHTYFADNLKVSVEDNMTCMAISPRESGRYAVPHTAPHGSGRRKFPRSSNNTVRPSTVLPRTICLLLIAVAWWSQGLSPTSDWTVQWSRGALPDGCQIPLAIPDPMATRTFPVFPLYKARKASALIKQESSVS